MIRSNADWISFCLQLVESEEREHQLGNEIERLRQALLQSEEVIASNLVALENREQYWQDQLVHPSSSNHEQLLDDDFEALKSNFEKLEDQLRCQVECSRNLQHDLEQFQRGKQILLQRISRNIISPFVVLF